MKWLNQKFVCCAWAGALALLHGAPAPAQVVLSEDYETSTVDGLPNATAFLLSWYGDFNSPSGFLWRTAQDGAMFSDPIGGPGNKSAALDNNGHGFTQTFPSNDGPTNATMGYKWTADPTTFTRGYIEYDFYLEPAPQDGFTYFDHRFGHREGDLTSVFVSTAPADTTAWYAVRVAGDQTASITSNGIPGVGAASVAPLVGAVNHLRVNFTPGFHNYVLNGAPVLWETPAGQLANLPWLPGADGVSNMTYVGDFQGTPGNPHGKAFIDNIHVVKVPEPTAAALAGFASVAIFGLRRRKGA